MDNFSLHLIDGTGNGATQYGEIDLPAFSLAAGGFYVICGQTNADLPPAYCDLDVTPDTELIQDGDAGGTDPDAVALRLSGVMVDTVSYEGDTAEPYVEGTGAGLADNPAEAYFSISRALDGVDSDNNAADFVGRCNSPSATNLHDTNTTGCVVYPVVLQRFVIE